MAQLPKTDLSVAIGVAAFGAYHLCSAYRELVPDLADIRSASPDDTRVNAELRDADTLIGGLALIAGGSAAILARSPIPLLAILTGYVWVAGFHHRLALLPGTSYVGVDE